ncbi:MAG: hypothetical protein ACOYXB_17170 [Bacteroidota bacterium]
MDKSKYTIQALQLIWSAIFASTLFLGLFLIYLGQEDLKPVSGDPNILVAVLAFFALLSPAAGYFISGKKISAIDARLSATDKIGAFSAALILRLASIEASAIFAVLVVFMTGDSIALVIAGLMLVLMILNFPSPSRIGNLLSLTDSELRQVRGGLGRD